MTGAAFIIANEAGKRRPSRSPAWLAVALALVAATAGHPAWARSSGSSPAADPDPTGDDWIIDQRQQHRRGHAVSVVGNIFTDRAGPGLWYAIPVAHDGILPRLNDSISIELGGDYVFHLARHLQGVWVGVGPRWDLYLTRTWQVFAAAKLGVFPILKTQGAGDDFFQPGISLGGEYQVGHGMRLRLEAGSPFGLRIGLTFSS